MKICDLLEEEPASTNAVPNPALADFATLLAATLLRSSETRGELDGTRDASRRKITPADEP